VRSVNAGGMPAVANCGSAPGAGCLAMTLDHFYFLMLAALFTHELDAVKRHEWRVLPLTSFLPERIGEQVFIWSHVLLFFGIFLGSQGASADAFRLGLSAFAVIACGGDGGGEGAKQKQPQQEQTEARTTPTEQAKSFSTDEFQPAFTLSVGEGWSGERYEQRDAFSLVGSVVPNSLLFLNAHTVYDVANEKNIPVPGDLTAWFRQHPYLETSDPTPVSVGGVSGRRFDLAWTQAPSDVLKDFPKGCSRQGDECIPTFVLTTGDTINVYRSNEYRVIILDDVAGETVAIIESKIPTDPATSPRKEIIQNQTFRPRVEEILDSVEWKGV